MNKIKVRTLISKNQSRNMIFMFVKHGNHANNEVRNLNNNQIKILFKQKGVDFNKLVQKCRNFKNHVPSFEVISPTHIEVSGLDANCSASVKDYHSDETLDTLNSDGVISLCAYGSKFEEFCKLRDLAIKECSPEKFYSALSKGCASVEAYIQHRVIFWNKHVRNPILSSPLEDNMHNKVSFEDKIKKWIPKMTGGISLNLGTKEWDHFKRLQNIRNNQEIHTKKATFSISYKKLAENINKLKIGFAGLLIDLHKLFNEPIPSSIIRASFFPEAVLTNKNST